MKKLADILGKEILYFDGGTGTVLVCADCGGMLRRGFGCDHGFLDGADKLLKLLRYFPGIPVHILGKLLRLIH